MADMSTENHKLTEAEIDELVVAEADDDSAWEAPVRVKPAASVSYSLPGDLADRASFLARLHHGGVEDWLTRVIRERVELEEVAYADAKREIAGKSSE